MKREELPGRGEGNVLPLVEQFYTLQGEGFHTGKAAYFIRIGGCDIGCRWCDSKVSWSPGIHQLVPVEDIVAKVLETPARAVVVTGGEPSLYNLNPLCDALKKHSIETFLETSGAYPLTGTWDWICLSPKRNMHPKPAIYQAADELKMIIYEPDDYLWAEECAKRIRLNCLRFLQPEWSRFSINIGPIVEYAKTHPDWMVSLQSHKFMRIP
ncbi:MAG TPA: 7-carboxy-7-deazaguanine synthase QueE [Marinilabiliales bacterium]|nr:MAG: 7-carboxy-7-deazaguanine synthase QueE [Bacteroidetes bacterium GWA2_40_14]OFX63315.1 MAG: 7-carboxy-7-deazaguanine synthase QueE [Bacteroidetes bacterium GWC2_40_13]OFX74623.1 MAG: 7-carboxy-7-deazaguanine synthase QueE [Bacteroidetes bacterium GWD2_40_43]OFX88951.1 MAG: 7-carboxy-7-deazaguanine synthase QueE [Bacteroidetes bacterium GWE2_40_63]OFY22757.1 MAG: 7-carboxy-7-deazaguanine synthase QueE [Bacteroidetes bacterium GWF2_40_13]OFZ32107.1 MAG: 7-carboxy-7-deazaguanine synthase Q